MTLKSPRFTSLIASICTMALAGFLASTALATDQQIQTAVSRYYSNDRDSFPCLEAQEEATDLANQKCSALGFDGEADPLSSVVVHKGRLDASNPADQKYMNQGYRTFCVAKSVVKCQKQEEQQKEHCQVVIYSVPRGLFGHQQLFKVNHYSYVFDYDKTLATGFKSYVEAYQYARRADPGSLGCRRRAPILLFSSLYGDQSAAQKRRHIDCL